MDVDKDIKNEPKTDNEIKGQDNNNNQEIDQNTSVQDSSKFLTFLKSNPLLFGLIVFGVISVITLAIVLPIVLIKEDDKNSNDQIPSPQFNDDISFDFDSIKNDNKIILKYNAIISLRPSDLDSFCSVLNEQSSELDDLEKIYIIYKWVAENIDFDFDKFESNSITETYSEPENVYLNNIAVSSGYSKLFKKLLTCMNFPEENIKIIEGYSKEIGYDIEDDLIEGNINHHWNAVKIEGNLCLIDTTLGAGCKENSEPKEYTEFYLCTPPRQLIRTHLPKIEQAEFQVLRNPINLATFKDLSLTTHYFFEYGFVSIEQDKAIQNICGEGKISLRYNSTTRPSLLLKIEKDDNDNNYDNWIMDKKIENGYEINLNINEGGNYDFLINVKKTEDVNYNIASFKIKCNSSPTTTQYFPEFTSDYKQLDDIQLISPLEEPLVQGKRYNFKIYYTNAEELYLTLGTGDAYEIIEMDKDGNYFFENDLLIHGDFVEICYKEEKNTYTSYNAFVRYTTSGETIDFPETYETPFKKRLESPLCSSLNMGSTYNFTIICDPSYNIGIYYENEIIFNNFNIVGNIHTLILEIDDRFNDISNIDIMYKIEGSEPVQMYNFPINHT